MRVLITNDDGIIATGLNILERIAATFATEVWTIAPETDQSGIGHALTLSNPLRIREADHRRYAVNGTPADCVICGVRTVLPELPDLILSGVNQGQNIADDVVYSGTIGGAMEGALMGIPSIAVSQAYQYDGGRIVPWGTVERYGPGLLKRLSRIEQPHGTFLNVNFPAVDAGEVKGMRICHQGKVDHNLHAEERQDGRGKPYHWLRFARGEPRAAPGSDLAALRDGYVAITPLKFDLTAHELVDSLADQLSQHANA